MVYTYGVCACIYCIWFVSIVCVCIWFASICCVDLCVYICGVRVHMVWIYMVYWWVCFHVCGGRRGDDSSLTSEWVPLVSLMQAYFSLLKGPFRMLPSYGCNWDVSRIELRAKFSFGNTALCCPHPLTTPQGRKITRDFLFTHLKSSSHTHTHTLTLAHSKVNWMKDFFRLWI
jgi:hypothetical protein